MREAPATSRRVAIVTGASSGLGRRIAEVLAADGAAVVITSRSAGLDRLEGVATAIRSGGGEALAVACDVSDEDAVAALAERVMGTHGRIDVLVNNAATRLSTKLLDTTRAEFDRIIGTNVVGPFLMWRHIVPRMVDRGAGNVINIVSTNAARQPFIGMAPYRMTKAALTFLSVDLSMELAADGVAVNALDPGPVLSEGTAEIRADREQRYGITIPYHAQDPATVIDEPIRWLAAQTASTFTGQVVRRTEFGLSWGPGVSTEAADATFR